jgi:transcriptional regulator with XRE-family HTH domain
MVTDALTLTEAVQRAILADPRTQREIAAAAGLHHTSLSRWLHGRHDLTGRHLDSLAAVLQLEVTKQKKPSFLTGRRREA